MYISTRENVINFIQELCESRNSRKHFWKLFSDDPFAKHLYKQELQYMEIEDYLDGELTKDDSKKYRKKIESDCVLAKEENLREKVNRAIKDIDLLEVLEKAHSDYMKQVEVSRSAVNQPVLKTSIFNTGYVLKWVAAASILFFIGLGLDHYFSNRPPLQERLYTEYYTPYNNNNIQQYVVNRNAINEAEKKYAEKDYYDALIILKNLPENINIRTEKDFYIALTLMETNSFDQAIEEFNSLISDNTEFKLLPQAYWYLGLCYLNTGQTKKASETFSYIAKFKGYRYEDAENILKKLR